MLAAILGKRIVSDYCRLLGIEGTVFYLGFLHKYSRNSFRMLNESGNVYLIRRHYEILSVDKNVFRGV